MQATLRGGPLDKRTIDGVTAETENIRIPANNPTTPKFALYQRVGNGARGCLLFDFAGVFEVDGPLTRRLQ